MSTGTNAPPSTALRKNSISTRHLVFFVIAAAAPLTVLAGFLPFTLLVGRLISPVGYLLGGLVCTLFTVGFIAMSRQVRDAGAFYAYIKTGLGDKIGSGAALVAYVGYTLGQIGFCAAAGLFASEALKQFVGADIPWGVSAVILGLVVGLLSYFQVSLGARVLAVLLIAEITILFVLAAAILIKGTPDGYSFAAFNPANWTFASLGPLLVLTFICYIGFEQTAIYSEEAKNATNTIPRATYIAVVTLTVVYTFMAWIIEMGIGPSHLKYVLSGDLTNVVFNVGDKYTGALMTDVMRILVVTSFFAGVLALQNAGSRYLFSMSRSHLIPARFSHTNAKSGSPTFAVVVQMVLVVVSIAIFALFKFDPYTQVIIWTNTPTLLGVIVLQIGTSVAVVVYFWRAPREETLWSRLIAPGAAALALTIVLVLIITKMPLLTGLDTVRNIIICAPLVLAFIGGYSRSAWIARHARAVAQISPAPAPDIVGVE